MNVNNVYKYSMHSSEIPTFPSYEIISNHNPNPPFYNNLFTFVSWNVISIATDNFHPVPLIEAHNSIFNYGLISLCETRLNDSI